MFKLKSMLPNIWVPLFAQIDLKQATVTIKDNAGTNSIAVTIGEGNLTYSEKRTMEYILDRGVLDEVREGDEQPVDVSFDFKWEYIAGTIDTANTPTINEALSKTGGAAAWVSTDADACRPYAVDIEVLYDPDCSTGNGETITLADFRYEELAHDLRAGTISCTGKCNVTTATAVRWAQTA